MKNESDYLVEGFDYSLIEDVSFCAVCDNPTNWGELCDDCAGGPSSMKRVFENDEAFDERTKQSRMKYD